MCHRRLDYAAIVHRVLNNQIFKSNIKDSDAKDGEGMQGALGRGVWSA